MAKMTKKQLKKQTVELENLKGAFKSFQYLNDEVCLAIFERYVKLYLVFNGNVETWCNSYKKGFKAKNSENELYYDLLDKFCNKTLNDYSINEMDYLLFKMECNICYIKGYIKL